MSCNVEGIKSYYRYRWLDHSGPTAVLHFEGQTVPHANIGQPPSALSLETAICICIVMASSLHLHLLHPLPNWKILRWGWDRFAVSWPVVALAMSWHVLGATEFCPNLCWYSARWPNRPNQSVGMFWNVLECFGIGKWKKVKEVNELAVFLQSVEGLNPWSKDSRRVERVLCPFRPALVSAAFGS